MTITQQPDALCMTGNMSSIRVATDTDVTMSLASGGSTLLTHTYSPTADNIVDINLRDIITSLLSCQLSNTSSPYQQTMICRPFTATISDGTDTETVSFKALRAGVDNLSDTVGNFLQHNFLTWQPNVKPVTYYTPEFLTYYAQQQVVVKCLAHIADGNETTVTLATISADTCVTIPVQYAIIAGLTNALPQWYDVWVETGGGTRLTYKQRYYAQDMRSEQEQWILFENSLGGIDTFRAYGDSDNTAEHTHNVAEIEEVSQEYRVDTERKYKKSTGRLDRNERLWLLDFFPSTRKYIYIGQSLRQIVVVESDVNYKASELPSSYTFTYRYADAKPYLNLPRTDVPLEVLDIQVPDVGSFTVAPRLVEFPSTPLSDGALFPVQDPYSEEWGTTTFGAICSAVATMISNATESIATIAHSHANKLFLDALSWESISSYFNGRYLSKTAADIAAGLITFAAGLVSNALAWFKQGIRIGSSADSTLGIDANANATLNNVTAGGHVTSPDLRSDEMPNDDNIGGSGYHVYEDVQGEGHVCTDYLDVRKKARFTELEIRRLSYINADQVQSMAASKVEKVLPIAADGAVISSDDTTTTVVAYRCLAVADDGSTATKNGWALGDQARCQTFNVTAPGTYTNLENRLYWRLVVRVGQCYANGEILDSSSSSSSSSSSDEEEPKVYHFFDLANIPDVAGAADGNVIIQDNGDEFDEFFADANVVAIIKANNDSYSFHGYMTALVNNTPTDINDVPAADDAVVQMGSQTDTDRMGFFITKADNLNTGPYIYAGVNNFTLEGKMITKITPAEVLISARKLKVFVNPNAGDAEPLVHYRGDWTKGSISYYYDEWDYQGSRWLCIYNNDSGTDEAPGTTAARWKQISTKGYKLLPSTDVIKTAKTGTNTYDPATASLTCGYVKSVGNNITSVADATAKIDDTYNIYFRRKARGGSWSTYYLYSDSRNYGTHARSLLSEFSLAQYEAVEFYLSTDHYSYSQMIIGIGGVYVRSSLTSYIDHVNVPVIADGENGTSPIVADLDNQMTSVACDKSGNVAGSSDKSLTTTVRMYKGSTKQTQSFSSITCKIGDTPIVGNSFVNGYKASVNTTTGVVTITVEHGTNIDGKTEVDITAVMTIDGTAVPRTVTFTISGIRAGADGSPATIYELLPSKDAISFGSGTTSQSMYMELLKIVGDSAETLAMNYIEDSGLYVLYGTTNVPDEDDAKKLIDNIGNVNHSDVKKWGTANGATGLSFSGNTATILSTAAFTQIYLALFRKVTADGSTSYILLDRETVPVVKDGAKGQAGQDGTDGNDGVDGADAVLVKLDPENIIITQSTEEVSGSYPLLTVGTITYNGSSTNVLGSATVKVVEGGVEKSNFSINSVSSDTCTAVKADDGKTIGITNVETSGGEYLTSGYVTVSVTYGDKTYSVRLNFYCNLLGTWKRSIENGIESDISRHIGYYIDPSGNVVTTQQLGEFIRGWSENTAKLTETVGSTNYGNNLFGFSKGVEFNNAIPFVQGYGVVSNVGSSVRMALENFGFEGKSGYYVVTCEAKMLNGSRDITFSFWGKGSLYQTRTIGNDWTKLTMVFNLTGFYDGDNLNYRKISESGYFYTEGSSGNPLTDSNRLAIRYLQIERGSVPSAFGICAEDAANASEAMPLSITAKDEMPLNSGSNPGNLEGQPFYGQDSSWNDDDTNWVSYTSGGQNHYYIDLLRNSTSVNLESGKIYTLSFWARASINGMSIRSFLYPNIITAQGNATYIDGDSSKGIYDDGMTELYLTTSWRKYYVHWYVASGGNKNLIIARLCDQIISGTNSDNLYGYIYLCGIRFDKGYVTSANRTVYSTVMKQTARTIDFSVMVNTQEKAGIHLLTESGGTPENENEVAKGIIDIVAGQVNFKDSNGENANTYVQIKDDGTLKAVNGEFSGKFTATNGSFTGSLTLPADDGVFSYGGANTTYGAFGLYMNSSLAISGQRTDYRNGGTTRGAVLRIEAARTSSSYRGIYCKGDAEVQGITQLLKASTSDSYNALIAEGITDKGELTVDGNFNANGQMILGVSILNTGSNVTLPKCAKGRVMICPGATTVGKATGVTLRDSTGSTVNSLSPNGRPRIFVAYDTDKWQEFYTG